MQGSSTASKGYRSPLVACRLCGTLQRTGALPAESVVDCVECGAQLRSHLPHSRGRTAWLASGALVLFVPAIWFPMASMEYFGNHNQFTLLQVVQRLFEAGHYFIGTFILLITILAPGAQILAWCVLGAAGTALGDRARLALHRIVQLAGPWNMNQIFLLALLVGVVQFGRVASLHVEPGALAFALVVALNHAAAATFEPADDWESSVNDQDFRTR